MVKFIVRISMSVAIISLGLVVAYLGLVIDSPCFLLGLLCTAAGVYHLSLDIKKHIAELETLKSHKVLKERADQLIKRFIEAYISSGNPSSLDIVIPQEDIQAFSLILGRENNIHVSETHLADYIQQALQEEQLRIFQSILTKHNKDLKENQTLEQLVTAYTMAFANNQRFLPYLQQLVSRQGADLSLEALKRLVDYELDHLSIELRAQQITHALDNSIKLRRITLSKIDGMNGHQFEEFLSRLFMGMGYNVQQTATTGDQGADLVLERIGERTVVQAKLYSRPVSNKAVQEVVAAKAHYGCHGAIVVTNNTFTAGAHQLAESNHVELWDRNKLQELIDKYM